MIAPHPAVVAALVDHPDWRVAARVAAQTTRIEQLAVNVAHILESRAGLVGITPEKWREVYGAELNAIADRGSQIAVNAFMVTNASESQFIYASWLRPLGSWARELLEHGVFVESNRSDITPHEYLVTNLELPAEVVSRFELECVVRP